MSMMKGEAIGIDLGTTYSCVGVWQHNRVEIITNEHGNRTTPSYVAFTDTECLVGDAAKTQAVLDPFNTIYDAKRLIGRRFSDSTVQRDMELWPFKVVSGNADRPQVLVKYEGAEKGYSPEELSSMVLMDMKRTAENYLRKKIKNCVVTVPAHFNDSQRQSTIDAATIAGLNVLRLLVEPTAAAVAYGLDKKLTSCSDEEKFVLVFDLGGGTFDVSLLEIGKDNIQVLATAGDTHLGGVDFDNRLVKHFVRKFWRKNGKDLTSNKKSLRRLRNGCESAKRTLSCANKARIVVDSLYEGIDFVEEISRSKFEELNMDLFQRCLETVKKCLKDADMEKSSIHDVVLVGGSTRIPKLQQLLQDFFDGKELCMSINPDEAVAYGATVLAASLSRKGNQCLKDLVLLDVTPLSLGVELKGKAVDIIIQRNTIIPARRAEEYITMEDNQTSLSFPVYEGERAKSTDNNLLGEITIDGLPPAPRGEVKVIVTFDIDADGLLHVSAEFKKAGIMTKTTIRNDKGRLTKKEIERMIEDAKKYRSKDKKFKRKIAAMNAFEDYVYKKRSAIRAKSSLSEDARKKLEKAIEEAINWINAHDRTAEADEYMRRKRKLNAICNLMSVGDSDIKGVEID